MGDAHPYWRLSTLVFVDSNEAYDLVDIGFVKACRFNLLLALVLLYVPLQDGIQNVIGR